MTKKRFVERYAGRTIKRLIGIEDIETNRVCVTIEENIRLLNELNDVREQLIDENEQLKQAYTQLEYRHSLLHDECIDAECDRDSYRKDIASLEKENEQLKQFQDRVFSWIDMHLQRLPTLRDDEFESDNEFADQSLYSGAIQILETMKRELKGDVECLTKK